MIMWVGAAYAVGGNEAHLTEIHVIERQEKGTLLDFIPPTTSLSGENLRRRREPTLGDTLKGEAGVNSNSFGTGASRPVIRGLDGDRIRVLQNGLGALDASAQSADHAVPLDTLNTERIEVVRGPMSLLYGSSAVGGVVNVVNQRLHTRFEEGHLWQAQTQTETVLGGHASGVRGDHGADGWMLHVDAGLRDAGDQRVSRQSDRPRGRVGNSQVEQRSAGFGVSRIFDRGHLGVSVGHFSSDYGSVAEPEVEIFMRQNRWELSGEWRFENAWADKMRVRSAYSRYRHDEREGGSVGTVFANRGSETRLEFLRERGEWSHVLGTQSIFSQFSAEGEEAYLPTSANDQTALFSFHERRNGPWTWSGGARIENQRSRAEGDAVLSESMVRGFTGASGSLGALRRLDGDWSLGANYSYTERAPTFQELYADGVHVATGTFDIGDDSLKKEKAHALELSLRRKSDDWELRWSVFGQSFDRYVALIPTGGQDGEGNAIHEYRQVGAHFWGSDAEARWRWAPAWTLVGRGDIVRAKNRDDGSNLPRISPARLTAGVEYERDAWSGDAEVQRVFEQTKTAPDETRTDGFTMVNLGGRRAFLWDDYRLEAFVLLKNIFDEQGRQHLSMSTVKDIAPLPGRNVVVGAQAIF
jgi:iron complex outermembrane receptor protein